MQLQTHQNSSEGATPKRETRRICSGDGVFYTPPSVFPLILSRLGRWRRKAQAAIPRARFASGAMPGHWLLPATHSCFWDSQGAAALGRPDLISKRGGRGHTAKPNLESLRKGEHPVPPPPSHLCSWVWGPWVLEAAKKCLPRAGAAAAQPPLCGPGASGQGRSLHKQLTAAVAPGLRRPPHGFLFDSGPPRGWLLLPCHQSSEWPVGSSEKGCRTLGKG